jgi:hypothetical protein
MTCPKLKIELKSIAGGEAMKVGLPVSLTPALSSRQGDCGGVLER